MAELLAEITKLSLADRIRLVQEILETISEETSAEAFSLTEAQRAEVERRSNAVKNGDAQPVSWESIKAKLDQRYGTSN